MRINQNHPRICHFDKIVSRRFRESRRSAFPLTFRALENTDRLGEISGHIRTKHAGLVDGTAYWQRHVPLAGCMPFVLFKQNDPKSNLANRRLLTKVNGIFMFDFYSL